MGQDPNKPKSVSLSDSQNPVRTMDEDRLADHLAQLHDRIRVPGGAASGRDGGKPQLGGADESQQPVDASSMAGLMMVLEKMKPFQQPAIIERPIEQVDTHPHLGDTTQSAGQEIQPPEIDSDSSLVSRAAPASVPVKRNQLEGLRIGRFQVRERIGQGGFGLVFRAYDPRLERDVALKIPSPEATLSLEQRRRFLREGRAAAALSHPHIVGVLEASEEAAICYIAAEFIDGVNLAQWKEQRGKLSQKQAAGLMIALAEAIQHAHSRQVLHRDLKPSNVLMKGDQPMISDFGLALRLDEDTSLITGDSIVGTPAFMAPEQARGQAHTIDARADVYGLGGILYFLLTNKPPLLGSSTLETLEWVRSREPVAPCSIDPTISADLQSICLKCLEKEPDRRYVSAHELYLDLQRFIEGLPVVARPVSSLERLFRWARRNPTLSSALASAVFFLLASLVASAVGWISTSRALRDVRELNVVALAAQQQSDQRFLKAKQTVDEYYTQVASQRLLNVPGLTTLRRELLQSALHYYVGFLEEASDDQSLVEDIERAHFRLGEILTDSAKPVEALDHFRQSERLLDQLLAAEPSHFSRRQYLNTSWSRIAKLQMLLGQPEDAVTGIQKAIDSQQQLFLERPESLKTLDRLASLWQQQAIFQRELRQPAAAHQTLVTVVGLREQLSNVDPENIDYRHELLSSQGNLANALRGTGQIPAAAELSNAVVSGWRELTQQPETTSFDRHSLLKALYNRALLALAMRQFGEAMEFLEEAGEVADQLALMFPGVEVHVRDPALMRAALAVAYMESGDIERAMASFQLAEAAFREVVELNPDSIDNQVDHALAQLNYGSALGNHSQDFAKGGEWIDQAQQSLAEVLVLSPGSFNARMGLINSHINLAAFAVELDEWEVALARSGEADSLLEGVAAEHAENPQVRQARSQAQVNRAKSLEKLSRWAEAVFAWKAVVELAFPRTGPVNKLRLAAALVWDEQLEEAAALLAEVETPLPDSPVLLMQHGRCHALLARGYRQRMTAHDVERSALIDHHVETAIQSLQRAYALGYFESSQERDYLETSPELDELRKNPQFAVAVGL